MIKILANNVRDYVRSNFVMQYKNFENAFDNVLFNVKMPFDEFSIRIDSDEYDGYSLLYFKKDNLIPKDLADSEKRPELDCFTIVVKQKWNGDIQQEVCQLAIWNYQDGRFYTQKDSKGKYAYEMRQSKEQIEKCKIAIETGSFGTLIHSILFTALLTVQFMHCKNVKLVENTIKTQQQKPKNKKKIPTIKYYTLNIEPLKEILRNEGNIEHNGFKKALHICRGHFKTYNENGLFGKVKGTFWFPQHIKGSKDEGEVVKDYKVIV